MYNYLKRFLLLTLILSKFYLSYSQVTKKSTSYSSTLTEAGIHEEVDKSFSKARQKFTIIDSTLSFKGIKFGSNLGNSCSRLQIKNIGTDSKMFNHKYGLIGNKQFCKIDTFSLIGFADFLDNKLVQISFESMNEYRHVASYFVKYFGMPDHYNDFSIIWTGKNIKMTVTDNSKVKDKSSIIGNANININLLNS